MICAAVRPGGGGLRWLSVAENAIGFPGGQAVARLLAQGAGCPLQGLCLAKNAQLAGGELTAVFRALGQREAGAQAGQRLEVLDVSGCGIGGSSAAELARALSRSTGLVVVA